MELKVAFLDCISHGDCAVITFDEKGRKACIVVDGGETKDSAKALTDYLKAENVKTIDLVVGTHIDSDHINGLKIFANDQLKKKGVGKSYIGVRKFWGPMPSQENLPDVDVQGGGSADGFSWSGYVVMSVKQNDELYEKMRGLGAAIEHPAVDNPPADPFTGVKLELLGPDTQIPADNIKAKALGLTNRASADINIKTLDDLKKAVEKNAEMMAIEANRNANNQSIVFRLSPRPAGQGGPWTFLFTGDAEKDAWDEMLANSGVEPNLPATVLKVPHHGSKNGITKAAAQKIKPDYSIISVGQKHGLPDPETLALMRKLKSQIFCTQRNDDKGHPSACLKIAKKDCPAKNNGQSIIFKIDTDHGSLAIAPKDRKCLHAWK